MKREKLATGGGRESSSLVGRMRGSGHSCSTPMNEYCQRWLKIARFTAAFFLATQGLPFLSSAAAQVSAIELSVKGLACPFCVYGIRKKVREVEGVESVDVNLKEGVVSIVPTGPDPPEPRTLKEAVKNAGFTAGDLRLTATGKLLVTEKGILLNVLNSSQTYLVFEPSVEPHRLLNKETKKRLLELAKQGRTVRIRGVVHTHQAAPAALSLETLGSLDE